jgi:GNAT superfamily N-acetyltransferase
VKQAITLTLQFKVLATPPSRKSLVSLRKDAGWTVESQEIERLRRPAPDLIWMAAVQQGSETPVGLGRLQLAGKGVAFLSEFVVKKELTGRGIGSVFLKHIENFCSTSGVERLALRPVPSSVNFYQSRGFAQDPVFPEVLMKILTSSVWARASRTL